ncbi:carbohydrate ABC transporter permease [Halanaerobium sp. Z-7514]|uniref:Carbohydrate ABC transporter permease n=1 Tax=Halanaerobium polyolivorans TaxID=2886943 RepID=A0AAW4WZ63_9FIRM|nr:carbohydrate ABC transporter permease [Halanaerobium polyolivorans]MCC3144615.1 carbohydrate ABC transporter permease [Halanaerobium polyolivorans]RQD70898.1 MAG: carbohydrate ABC transporter permease [Halanaerobium sp. MSAO_Bac5]
MKIKLAKIKEKMGHLLGHAILMFIALIAIVPLIWALSTSIQPSHAVFGQGIGLIPTEFRFENYLDILNAAPFGTYLINTIIVVTFTVIMQLLVIIPAAYAFAKLEFFGRDVLFFIFIAQMLLPLQAIVVPNYDVMRVLGLINTRTAMVLPFIASGYGTFLIRQQFKQIPESLIESARIDGAGHFTILKHVMIPLSKPIITAFSLISIVIHWNDYFWPLIITETPSVRTLAIGLGMFVQQESGADWTLLMAGTMFIVMPLLIFFIFNQRIFIESLMIKSGMKE